MENVEQAEGAVASEPAVKEDPWASAEEAFEAAEVSEPKVEKEEVKEAKDSHVEAEVPEYLKRLDLTKIPHKYKPLAADLLRQTVEEFETKSKSEIEAKISEAGQYKEAVLELVNIFRDIADSENSEKATEKLARYVSEHGKHIGLDPTIANRFQARKEQAPELPKVASLEEISGKYAQALLAVPEDQPQQFVNILAQQNAEIAAAVQKSIMTQVGQLLNLYHQNYIAPDKETLQEFKERSKQEAQMAEFNGKRTSWNQAADNLKAKHTDFEKYKPEILKAIKEKRTLASTQKLLNENADDIESREEFLESVYLLVSQNDRLNAVKPRSAGLPPSSKNITTKKTGGGGNWERAWENSREYFQD